MLPYPLLGKEDLDLGMLSMHGSLYPPISITMGFADDYSVVGNVWISLGRVVFAFHAKEGDRDLWRKNRGISCPLHRQKGIGLVWGVPHFGGEAPKF